MEPEQIAPHYFCDDPRRAEGVFAFLFDHGRTAVDDQELVIRTARGKEGGRLPPELAGLLCTAAFLVAREQGVLVQGIWGTLTLDEVAALAVQEREEVEEAVANGLIDEVEPGSEHVPVAAALRYKNHVRAMRQLVLGAVADSRCAGVDLPRHEVVFEKPDEWPS